MSNITTKARDHSKNNDYASTLECYIELAKTISPTAFSYNIKKYIKKIDAHPSKRPTSRISEINLQIQGCKIIGDIEKSSHYLDKLLKEAETNPSQSAITISQKERSTDLYAIKLITQLKEQSSNVISKKIKGKLLYVLHHSLPYISNGYATRAHGLAAGMMKSGLNVVCITRPGFPIDVLKSESNYQESNIIDGVIYKHIRMPLRSGPHRSKNYFEESALELKNIFERESPSAILVASNYVNAIPAILAAKALGIKIAYEVRGFWEITEESKNPDFSNSFEYKLKIYLETLTYKTADKLFTLGSAMKEELAKRGGNPKITSLLPNACNTEQFQPTIKNKELLSSLRIDEKTPIIGYIGSFVQYEGLDILVEACALLDKKGIDFKLILIGSNSGDVYDRINNIIQKSNLSHRIILPGRIPHDDVQKWYSIIDIAPFPRKSQPVTELVTPLKPMEAMAMEKAVIVSSVKAMSEMVEHRRTGLVFEKDNTTDLALHLEEVICNKVMMRQLGKNARSWITSNRTWEIMGNKVKTWVDASQETSSEN